MTWPRIAPLGDSAVTVALGDRVELALNRRVHALAAAVRAASLPGVVDVVPAYAAVTVFYEPLYQDHAAIAAAVAPLAAAALADHLPGAWLGDAGPADVAPRPREHVIPVRYDGDDLAEVAHRCALTPAEVVRRHADTTYTVYLLGFVPGFAYLGDLDLSLVLPRRASPRRRVPEGSVAIAGRQTAVYPLPTPGGWHLIGRTEASPLDLGRSPPSLFEPGDRVRFVPV